MSRRLLSTLVYGGLCLTQSQAAYSADPLTTDPLTADQLPTECAHASFPTASRVDYWNDCPFQVVFTTTCAVGAVNCFGQGAAVIDPKSHQYQVMSGGPFWISQPRRAK